jgi:hypothetical protein
MNDDIDTYRDLMKKLIVLIKIYVNNKITKKTVFHDGIYYSVRMIQRTYNNLIDKLKELAEFKFSDPTIAAEMSISEVWFLVDSLYRLRKLLEDTPDLKQNSPQLRIFYEKTKILKNFRDSFQHLDEFLQKYIPYKIPAWGRLSWVYPVNQNRYKSCVISPGDIQPDWKLWPTHMGEKMRSPIDFITLTTTLTTIMIKNHSICITHIINALDALVPWLNIVLDNNFTRKHQLMVACAGINTNYNINP